MKNGTFAVAGTLALGLATWVTPGMAQGPLYDRVDVNLPYTVTIGDKTLQPGEYVIRELPSLDKSRVLLIYSDNGMKFQTSTMTIPTLDMNTPEDTKVVLHHFGSDYYFDKVWIQGKNYGYEFPLPNSVKQREKERMEPVAVTANYQSVPAETNNAEPAPPAEPAPEPAPPVATMEPQAATELQTAPPATEPAITPQAVEQPATTAPATDTTSMPATSAGWLMMLVGGGALSGAGLALRRRR